MNGSDSSGEDLLPRRTPAPSPRAGARTITATTSEYCRWRLCRVGLTVDDAVAEELSDYRHGLKGVTGEEADEYASDQPDVALWDGERVLAVVRPSAGGEPIVTRFDDTPQASPEAPDPWHAKYLAEIIQRRGASKVYWAFWDSIIGPPLNKEAELAEWERTILFHARGLGEKVAMERLVLAGPYGVIADVMSTIGHDGMEVIRRMVAEGRIGPVAPAEGGANISP